MKMELPEEVTIGVNMTAMADIVFLLILFFMLASDFTQTDLAKVQLPLAVSAVEDEHPDPDRLIVNLEHRPPDGKCSNLEFNSDGELKKLCYDNKHWIITIKNDEISIPDLEKRIRKLGDKKRDATGKSDMSLMIRTDSGAPYSMFEKVFSACARAMVWKIEIGASKKPK